MDTGKAALTLEFLLIFVACPLAFRLLPAGTLPLPMLWAIAAYCLWILRRDAGFDRRRLWNAAPFCRALPPILLLFVPVAAAMALVVWRFLPARFFGLLRHHTLFWVVVMLLYPVLSVYPQSLIYRAFFFQRYRPLFGDGRRGLVAAGLVFAFMHIIFRNYWAVGLTLVAGLVFAWRYQRTQSLLVSSIEHALYGCYVFIVGLGALFYHGAGRAAFER
jgi:membrane protease YdiL (CAAX protease family)